jgi:hypothetical protein
MSIKHFARLLPLVLFFLIPNLSSAATESVRVIRQDCTGYTNCYTSLSAWEATENRDLTATDEIAVARIATVMEPNLPLLLTPRIHKYQKKYNIVPASGYVGPLTRGKLEGR